MSSLEKQIERIAEIKNDEIIRKNYDNYHFLYDILIEFLKKKNVLMYGGLAINQILPKEARFYKKYELPDIDIVCTDGVKLINSIIEHFKKDHNIQLVSAKEALHESTYKVFVEGVQLLDVTVLSKRDFLKMKKNSIQTDLGIPTVNIYYLKYSLHLLSAQSLDAHRWGKVYERMLLMYKYYPVDLSNILWDDFYTDIPSDLSDALTSWITDNKLISFGWDKIQSLLEPKLEMNDKQPIKYLLYDGNLKELVATFKWPKVKTTALYSGDGFIGQYIALTYNNERFCYIFKPQSCLSIITKNNKTELTIHSLLAILYMMYLSSQIDELLYVIGHLTKLCLKLMKKSKNLNKIYSTECYGPQVGIITLRRKMVMRQMMNKNIFKK